MNQGHATEELKQHKQLLSPPCLGQTNGARMASIEEPQEGVDRRMPSPRERTGCRRRNSRANEPASSGVRPQYSGSSSIVLRTTLQDHQKVTREWMASEANFARMEARTPVGGIIADEYGMGKTLQAVAGTLRIMNRLGGATLVVCTKSLVSHWRDELFSHTTLDESQVHVLKRNEFEANAGALYVVVTYDKLRYLFQQNLHQHISRCMWTCILLDEAHTIRTSTSSSTRVILGIASRSRWCVTSTPFNNDQSDVATLCQFIGVHPYADPQWWCQNGRNQQLLSEWRANFLLKRSKALLNLPPPILHTISVKFSDEERAFYDLFYKQVVSVYDNMHLTAGAARAEMLDRLLVLILRLRQLCNHPALVHYGLARSSLRDVRAAAADSVCHSRGAEPTVPLGKGRWSRQNATSLRERKRTIQGMAMRMHSSKVDALRDYLDQRKDTSEKFVVFSQWTSFLDVIELVLDDLGLAFVRFDGTIQSSQRRGDLVDEFTREPSVRVFLSSLQTGCTGLNLTAAQTVIIMDKWFNPYVEEHAKNRTHRIGQTRQVHIVRFEMENTIEARVSMIQEQKMRAAGNILSGGAFHTTEDDIEQLLRDPIPAFRTIDGTFTFNVGRSTSDVDRDSVLASGALSPLTTQLRDMRNVSTLTTIKGQAQSAAPADADTPVQSLKRKPSSRSDDSDNEGTGEDEPPAPKRRRTMLERFMVMRPCRAFSTSAFPMRVRLRLCL